MNNANKGQIISVSNRLTSSERLRKGILGSLLLALSLFLLFGPRFEGDNTAFLIAIILIAFMAFGFGWAGLSQGIMGWSNEVSIDFAKNEVRQCSATFWGRSRAYIVPFLRIMDFKIQEKILNREGESKAAFYIEFENANGGVYSRAGPFSEKQEVEAIIARMKKAIEEEYKEIEN